MSPVDPDTGQPAQPYPAQPVLSPGYPWYSAPVAPSGPDPVAPPPALTPAPAAHGEAASGAVGGIAHAERSLAPDLARGAVLLFIALANVVAHLYGPPVRAGNRPVDGSPLDRSLDLLVSLFVDQRSYPMFAILLGYGLATMARRLESRGLAARELRRVLRRRNLGLVGFGALHATFAFSGDILGIYGLTGLLATPLLARARRTRVVWTVISLVLLTVIFALEGFAGIVEEPPPPSGYLANVGIRLGEWALLLAITVLLPAMLGLVLIGVEVSRAGLLDRPWDHLPRLRRIAAAGLSVNVVLGLPYALAVAGLWTPGAPVAVALAGLHAISGVAAGLAYLSLFALLAAALRGHPRGPGPTAIAAVGERSLTCYLLQSVLFAPLLAPWGFGLGGRIGTAAAYGIAVVVWALTVAAAVALAAAGRRGPAEVVLRRFAYGHRSPQGPAIRP